MENLQSKGTPLQSEIDAFRRGGPVGEFTFIFN